MTARSTTLPHKRRGAVMVLVAVMSVALIGFVVMTVDVGVLYTTKADLQNAADAAALSSAQVLISTPVGEDALAAARAAAVDVVGRNDVFGRTVTIDPIHDVVFGKTIFNEGNHTYTFTPTEINPDGVRITVRHTEGSPNGPVPLYFAHIFGIASKDVQASAVAARAGSRDIAVVVDLSGSMKHDSYLRFYDQYQINARDIWASLDGPLPSRPYIPGEEHETEYAFDNGPTIGIMDNWGNPITPTGYDPTVDPGLWYIPRDEPCTEPDILASLQARGYSASQIDAVMAGGSSEWENRTAVMIGLAEWTPSGSGDNDVESDELTWVPLPPYRKTWSWTDYIGWAGESNSKLTNVHPEYQYRFGVKTYTDFLLDRVDNHSKTDLTHTPEEPLRAVKDAVQALADVTGIGDHMSLEIFGSTGNHEIDLSGTVQDAVERLYEMQANHYDNSTNIGEGLQRAIDELTSERARDGIAKVLVLMSDGANSTGPDPILAAHSAAENNIRVYTVSVGLGADRSLMQQISAITGGEEFYAVGEPVEYTSQLQQIYRTIGSMSGVALIE